MKTRFYGYALGALAAASYGTNPLFAYPLMQEGMNAGCVLFLRYSFAIPMLAIIMTVRGRGFGLRRNQLLPLVLLGLCMGASSLTLYESYTYIGASIASTLLFIYPILTTLIMVLLYHEKASFTTILCIVVASLGIALLYHGGDGGVLNTTGVVLVVLSALTYAIYLVACNRPTLRVIPTLKLTLYVIVFGMVAYIPYFDMQAFDILAAKPHLWLHVLGLALIPTAFSLIATSAAIQRIGSTPVAILGAMEPVTAVTFAVTVFGEPLTPRLATGMFLIILAVTMIIAGGAVKAPMMRVRKMFPRIVHHERKKS